jgi:hypothetical protein
MRSADHSIPIIPIVTDHQPADTDIDTAAGAGVPGTDAETPPTPALPPAPGPWPARQRRYSVVTRFRNEAVVHCVVPEIRISGRWLVGAGFPSGSRLAVTITPGRLVVTVVAPPEPLVRREPLNANYSPMSRIEEELRQLQQSTSTAGPVLHG